MWETTDRMADNWCLKLWFESETWLFVTASEEVVLDNCLGIGEPLALVLLGLAAGGVFICCFVISGQVYVNRQATADIRASAQAILVLVNGSGLLLGHFLVGWVRDVSDDRHGVGYAIAAIL